jgi:tetratricopeptide (TPR) repeat protein
MRLSVKVLKFDCRRAAHSVYIDRVIKRAAEQHFTWCEFSDTLDATMSQPPQMPFLDVPVLLENSQPAHRGSWFWYGVGMVLLVVLISAYANTRGPQMAGIVRAISALLMLGLMVGMGIITWLAVKAQRGEQFQLEAAEELVTLRRWPQAAVLLETMLSRPTRTTAARVQALIYLSSVLARYHRFEDAIAVQNHLLENVNLDESTVHALRLGRAMAMLRDDHLFDADRAISDLRRSTRRSEEAESDAKSGPGFESAGLALIEIYRDVKTGHPAEAIELFNAKLPILRQQLGHRVSDAWALAGKAYDLLGRADEAQDAYEKATLLSPPEELHRRYPEVQALAEKYRAAATPTGN